MRTKRLLGLSFVAAVFLILSVVFRKQLQNVQLDQLEKPWAYVQSHLRPNTTTGAGNNTTVVDAGVEDSTHEASSIAASSTTIEPTAKPSPTPVPDRIVVMGKLAKEDTSWVSESLPDWANAIYTVDDHNATLHTAKNKGREANAYLTYIVQNYHALPSLMVFIHSHRSGYPQAWHTDTPNWDNVKSVMWLNRDFVMREGYVNLRCQQNPGCPDEVQVYRDPPAEDQRGTIEEAMPAAWYALFGNNTKVPEVIATPCCAQFAVSREQVLKRPLAEYERFLDWLMRTPLPDATSGRVFEYLWHIIFGRDAVHCPALQQCYSDIYNMGE